MTKMKNTLGKLLSILAVICFLFSLVPSLPVLAEGANTSLTSDKSG
jgi:hypothetical protein